MTYQELADALRQRIQRERREGDLRQEDVQWLMDMAIKAVTDELDSSPLSALSQKKELRL